MKHIFIWRNLSLSTQIEENISYKFGNVTCIAGYYFDAIIYVIGSIILRVVILARVCYILWMYVHGVLWSQWFCCVILIEQSFNSSICHVFTNFANILSWRRDHLLFIHSFLSHMSTLYVPCNLMKSETSKFTLTIASVKLRKRHSYFHWLPTNLFKSIIQRHIV